MSESAFPMNDLARRKLQTLLTITVICLSIASTMFTVSLGNALGFQTFSLASNRLTTSFAGVFSNFILFTIALIFVSGLVAVSFMIYVMMEQRTRDIGLMKASGCPNSTIFGSYMTELTIISLAGCLVGTAAGFAISYASVTFLKEFGPTAGLNIFVWAGIFLAYFLFSLAAGAKPIMNATRMSPVTAMSPQHRLGIAIESDFRGARKMGLSFKIAFRSIFRRKRSSLYVILCLLSTLTLVTVALTGALVADRTTTTWVQRASNSDILLIAHQNVSKEYQMLSSKFYENRQEVVVNYTDAPYLITDNLISELKSLGNITVDPRLFFETTVKEVKGYSIDPETLLTTFVGDDRQATSLVVGVEPENATGSWVTDGRWLVRDDVFKAVLGDSLATQTFSVPRNESIDILGQKFQIGGVCIEPLNNGHVVYVPLGILEMVANVSQPNLLLVKIAAPESRVELANEINRIVNTASPDLTVYNMNDQRSRQIGFLSSIWDLVFLLPILGLLGASACMVAYVVLTLSEQQHEFGVMRAIGARPRAVGLMLALQNALILLAGLSTSVALGIMITLMILVPEPVVTTYDILQICASFILSFAIVIGLSMLPIVRLVRKPLRDLLAKD